MTERPTILVPVQVLEGESIPEGIPDLLANAHVVLLGYHVVPEQTATDQARVQFVERATKRLDSLASMLEAGGATVETQLAFTHDGQTTIDRIIYEHDCIAVLVPHATAPPDDVLVAVRGTVGVDRLVRLVAGLFGDGDVDLTLFHALDEGESDADAVTLLEGVADRLEDAGVPRDIIDIATADEVEPLAALVDRADDYDAVVVGETDPSVVTFLFGMRTRQVADRFLGPVLVVQRERPTDDGET